MVDVPHITFHALMDQPSKVFVHLGEKVRTFTEANMDRLPATLQNVLIAEFGLRPEHAEEVAAEAVSKADAEANKKDHVELLQEQLSDNDKQLTEELKRRIKAESDLALAQSDLRTANTTIDDLRAQLVAALPPPSPPKPPEESQGTSGAESAQRPDPANTGETGTAGSADVGTKPEGQTPPAQHADTPPAMEPATPTAEVQTSPPAPAAQTGAGAAPVLAAATGGAQEAKGA